MPMPFNIFLNYVQTFMLFPGVAFKKTPIFGLGSSAFTILLLAYNVFDTVGKTMPSYYFLSVK